MDNEKLNEFFQLTPQDFSMVLEGLEALKSKDFAGELMSGLFEAMLVDKKKMSPVELQEYEEKQRRKKIEEERKKVEQQEFKKRIDVLKAKITLIIELEEKRRVQEELKKPERQIETN
ncbi:MAG: hypothetical protein AB1757_06685 [Acidobacteriota bacterium]